MTTARPAPEFSHPASISEAERRKSDLLLAIEQMDSALASPPVGRAADWAHRTRSARAYRRWELRQINQWLREQAAPHYEMQIKKIIEVSLPPNHPWRLLVGA